jgi:hypothetical protein
LAQAIAAHGQAVTVVSSGSKLRQQIHSALQPGDLVLFLGAGADITVAAHAFADELRANTSPSDFVPLPIAPAVKPPPAAPEALLRSAALMCAERAGFYLEATS